MRASSAQRLPRALQCLEGAVLRACQTSGSFRGRREELAAASDRGLDRSPDRGNAGDLYASCRDRSLEPAHERVERRSCAGATCARHDSPGEARRTRFSGQAVPQLPFAWRNGWAERSGSGQRCRSAYAGPTHPPGNPGRRQHASVREKPKSSGDYGAGGISRDSTSRGPSCCPRCRTRCGAKGERYPSLGRFHVGRTPHTHSNVVVFYRDLPCACFCRFFVCARLASRV